MIKTKNDLSMEWSLINIQSTLSMISWLCIGWGEKLQIILNVVDIGRALIPCVVKISFCMLGWSGPVKAYVIILG
jgi:hypothetical protein